MPRKRSAPAAAINVNARRAEILRTPRAEGDLELDFEVDNGELCIRVEAAVDAHPA